MDLLSLLPVIAGVLITASITWLNNRQSGKLRVAEIDALARQREDELAANARERAQDREAAAAERTAERAHASLMRERDAELAREREDRQFVRETFGKVATSINTLETAITLDGQGESSTLSSLRIGIASPLAATLLLNSPDLVYHATRFSDAFDVVMDASFSRTAVQPWQIDALRQTSRDLLQAMREYDPT